MKFEFVANNERLGTFPTKHQLQIGHLLGIDILLSVYIMHLSTYVVEGRFKGG